MAGNQGRMVVVFHHRTKGIGAEGNHIKGIQEAFEDLGYQIKDISLCKGYRSKNRIEESSIETRLTTLSDRAPDFIFSLMQIGYNFLSFIRAASIFLINRNYFTRKIVCYERYSYFGIGVIIAARLFHVPLILEVNNIVINNEVRAISFLPLARILEKFCLRNADCITVVSTFLKKQLVEEYKISAEKIVVTPNAINPLDFELQEMNLDIPLLNNVVNFVKNRVIIGFVGVLVPWHGVELLIDVFKELTEIFSGKIGLLVVGDGPSRSSVEKLVEDYGLRQDVLFTGMLHPALAKKVISVFDIAVMPDSNYFGSPMKVFEYMACGKAVVAPDYPPILEVIDHKKDGLIFKKRDKREMIEAIKELLSEEPLRNYLGQNARAKVLSSFTWKNNLRKILSHCSEFSSIVAN